MRGPGEHCYFSLATHVFDTSFLNLVQVNDLLNRKIFLMYSEMFRDYFCRRKPLLVQNDFLNKFPAK